MRGKKARQIRREVALMAPHLRREMKAEIAKHAAERADAIRKARRRRNEKRAELDHAYGKALADAWAAFEGERAKIRAEYERRAAAELAEAA